MLWMTDPSATEFCGVVANEAHTTGTLKLHITNNFFNPDAGEKKRCYRNNNCAYYQYDLHLKLLNLPFYIILPDRSVIQFSFRISIYNLILYIALLFPNLIFSQVGRYSFQTKSENSRVVCQS